MNVKAVQKEFLESFVSFGTIRAACKSVGVDRDTYKVLHSIDEMVKSDDPKMVFEKYKHLYTKLSNTKKVLPVSKHEFF